jgi:cell division protein FtsQ
VLEGRKAVASALADSGGRTVPLKFDSQGVVFEVGGNPQFPAGKFPAGNVLPVISGLSIEGPYPGMRLPPLFIPFFKELEKLQGSAPELLDALSEIKINRKLFDTFDLILYPAHRKVKVRIQELNEETLRYTLLMVDVLSQKESGIDSFDFRSGIASYIPKEASSE